MVTTNTTDSTSDSGTTSSSGSGGIVDFLLQPVGMALAGGVVITLIAGWVVF